MSDNIHPIDPKNERLQCVAANWIDRQNLGHIRVLARIDSISHMDTGPTREVAEGAVFLGGYDTNWQVTALSGIDVCSGLCMYSTHETRAEFEKACGQVRKGQHWIIDGELFMTRLPPPNHQVGFDLLILGPTFTAIPDYLMPGIAAVFKINEDGGS